MPQLPCLSTVGMLAPASRFRPHKPLTASKQTSTLYKAAVDPGLSPQYFPILARCRPRSSRLCRAAGLQNWSLGFAWGLEFEERLSDDRAELSSFRDLGVSRRTAGLSMMIVPSHRTGRSFQFHGSGASASQLRLIRFGSELVCMGRGVGGVGAILATGFIENVGIIVDPINPYTQPRQPLHSA